MAARSGRTTRTGSRSNGEGLATSKTLRDALAAAALTNRELAAQAGISYRTIAEAQEGIDRAELTKPRRLLGIVASMTRLADSLEVPAEAVLQELGISPTEPAVRSQIRRVREAQSGRSGPPRRGPVVGVVAWEPFSDGPGSIAYMLTRSALGSLNPTWDRDENIRAEGNFIEAERRLLSDEPGRPDCLIGLYDLPWRRQGDVDIVPLPGLRVTVAGLCTRAIRWTDILATKEIDRLPHALVIEGDVGARLLTGAVDYPVARLITPFLKTYDRRAIAQAIELELDDMERNPGAYPDGFLFVADGPLAKGVAAELAHRKLEPVGQEVWAPSLRFGFALRHSEESRRLKELLEEAISQDLLERVLPRTVHLYLSLLRSDRTGQVRLNLTELDAASQGAALRFVQLAKMFYPNDYSEFLRSRVTDPVTLRGHISSVEGEAGSSKCAADGGTR